MISWGTVPLGAVLPFPFATYAGSTGASVTLTGLAVTDIEIYKGSSVTQRASDAGYTLIDTDGIDIDGITGIHGFVVDTGDNTDAGFFVAGSFYYVVVSAVTVDSQTVNFVAGTFTLRATESVAGVMEVDVTHVAGATTDVSALATNVAAILVDTGTTLDGRIPAALVGGRIDANVGAISADATAADNAEAFFDGTGYAGTNNVIPTVTTLTGHTAQTGDSFARLGAPAGASVSADVAAVKVDTAAILVDTGTTLDGRIPAALVGGRMDASVGAVAANAITAASMAADASAEIADAVWDEAKAGHTTAGTYGEHFGTATESATVNDAGATTTAFITTLASAVNDHYVGRVIIFTSGTLLNQASSITDYVGATKTLTVTALTSAPANGVSFLIV